MLYPLSYGGNVLQLLDFQVRAFRSNPNSASRAPKPSNKAHIPVLKPISLSVRPRSAKEQ